MPTYAAITVDLLKDAATFFRTLADQNEGVKKEMTENAAIYERMAEMMEKDPRGAAPGGQTFGQLSARLLQDTANLFRKLAVQNEPIREQMEHNANIYDQVAEAVAKDPLAILD
jgi:hypothetical protein